MRRRTIHINSVRYIYIKSIYCDSILQTHHIGNDRLTELRLRINMEDTLRVNNKCLRINRLIEYERTAVVAEQQTRQLHKTSPQLIIRTQCS
jgi:hypothetical protein